MDDIIDADDTYDADDADDADDAADHYSGDLERYRAINYLDGDEHVTIIQERENDDAWIQSDGAIDVPN